MSHDAPLPQLQIISVFFSPSEPLAVLQKSRFSAGGGAPRHPEPPAALFSVPFAAVSGDNADQWPGCTYLHTRVWLDAGGLFSLSAVELSGGGVSQPDSFRPPQQQQQISVDVMCCNVDSSELALQIKMLSLTSASFPSPALSR